MFECFADSINRPQAHKTRDCCNNFFRERQFLPAFIIYNCLSLVGSALLFSQRDEGSKNHTQAFHLQPIISGMATIFKAAHRILPNWLRDAVPPDKACQFPHGRARGSFSLVQNVSVRLERTAVKQNERNRSDCFRLKPIIIPPKPGFFTLALQVRRGSGGAREPLVGSLPPVCL